MRLKNNYTETVYWRAFKEGDTSYITGLKQGSVAKGKIIQWVEDSFPRIKVEAKLGDIVFSSKVLASAGTIYNMSDDLIVNSSGISVAKVGFDAPTSEVIKKSDLQFIDLRNFDAEVIRELTSTLTNIYSSSKGVEQSHEHSQTWSVKAGVGGSIGKKDTKSKNGNVSVEYVDKVTDSLTESYSETVSSIWSQEWKDTLPLSAKKIHVLDILWSVTVLKGTASYYGESTHYSVIQTATPSLLQASSYKRISDMSQNYQDEFNDRQ